MQFYLIQRDIQCIFNYQYCIGSMEENKIYDNCDFFHPGTEGRSSASSLRIRFSANANFRETGFLLLFNQEGIVKVYIFHTSTLSGCIHQYRVSPALARVTFSHHFRLQ
jgi:hypothetical protein